VRRTPRGRPRVIGCATCGYLIYDYPRSAAGMLVVRRDAILLLRRAHPPGRGMLDIPGGFMEAGESFEDAARRELREETGLVVGRVRALGTYWDRYYLRGFGWFPTMNVYFVSAWRSGVPVAADDAASAEWVPLGSLGRRGARYAWAHMGTVFRDLRASRTRRA
jgi:ADP-ribose pyrophosphatase YjhB (NUDIX family)